MNKPIGGYFELELRRGEHYHKNAIKLNTARNCLEYILTAKKYKKIYIPYYTCEVMLEPLKKLNISYEFYTIDNDLNPIFEREITKDEAFLYTNYFGVKQETVEAVVRKYQNVIIDNSQAFFSPAIKGIDTFYSARKFFGVPDGAYLYTNTFLEESIEQDVSFERMSHLLKRIDLGAEVGYIDFQQNDKSLENQSIRLMSKLTEKILMSIDYEDVKYRRIQNYIFLDEQLSKKNEIQISLNSDTIPMVYPYLNHKTELKERLINNKIFIPTYWTNVRDWVQRTNCREIYLVSNLICLPIDQRYTINELNEIIKRINDEG